MTTLAVTSRVPEIRAAIDELEQGELRLLRGVSWEEYEELLKELGDGYATRITYDNGELELMAPLFRHEHDKDFLLRLVGDLTIELGIEMESAGSVTLKKQRAQSGAEPDTCFYLKHAEQVRGKIRVDLRFDPPPDIVVEVDVAHPSRNKGKIYARFGVPEFWRYDGQQFEIFELVGRSYQPRSHSVAFPFLGATNLIKFLESSRSEGHNPALLKFRRWLRRHKPKA